MGRQVTISIYCMFEWWKAYFYDHYPMPEVPSDKALERIYLERQKFLYEHFGEFGIGDPNPKASGEYLNMIARYSLDFIPHLLGVQLSAYDGGGFTPVPLSEEAVAELKPVVFENTPMAEWIYRRYEKLKSRYGSAVSNIALEGPLNLAYRVMGDNFFLTMYDDEDLAHHLLDVITQTTADIYRFQAKLFGMEEYNIANCLASAMLSPASYEEFGLPYDRQLCAMSQELTGNPRAVKMHHCDAHIDTFAHLYGQIPQLYQVEARTTSNYDIIRKHFPGASMSAIVNCKAIDNKPIPVLLEEDIAPALREDITAFIDMWTFSQVTPPEQMKLLFQGIRSLCRQYDVEPVFSMIPFYWEELEWAFPWWEDQLDHWVRKLGD